MINNDCKNQNIERLRNEKLVSPGRGLAIRCVMAAWQNVAKISRDHTYCKPSNFSDIINYHYNVA